MEADYGNFSDAEKFRQVLYDALMPGTCVGGRLMPEKYCNALVIALLTGCHVPDQGGDTVADASGVIGQDLGMLRDPKARRRL